MFDGGGEPGDVGDIRNDFNLVAAHGGFGRASKASGGPKVTLSRHVRELEESLGARLLDRGSRTLRLTEEGHKLYARTALGRIAAGFLRVHRDVRLEVTADDRRVDLVEEGYDVVRLPSLTIVRDAVCTGAGVTGVSLWALHPSRRHSLLMSKPLLVIAMIALAWPGRAAEPTASGTVPGTDSAPEIIVSTPRGRASGGIAPLLDLSSADLDSYGADTLSDLVGALRPLTRSSRSDQMAVVLINGHLAGQTEFDNLPREAIERVEVLPESVALQYGFSENQRVLNFILREHYRAVPLRISDSGASEGGAQVVAADASLVRLEDEARVTLLASYKDSAWLRESDRGIDAPDSAYRTLVPNTEETKIAATVSRLLWGVSSSLEGSFDVLSSKSLQGLAATGGENATGSGAVPLDASAPVRTARVATQFTGQLRDFVWGATAYYQHVASRSSSDIGVDAGGKLLVDRSATGFSAGNLQLSLSGPAATLPAGPVIANVKFALQYQGFDTHDAYPGASFATSDLVRTIRSGSFNASLPLASRARGVLPSLGDVAATLNAAIDTVSDFGTLLSTSYGLDARPFAKLHLDAIYTDHRLAPTLQQLRAPPVFTPNVETFDYVTGQTAYVTTETGGDPLLAATDSRQASFGVAIGPFLGRTEFLAHYEQSWISNAVGALPPTTAAVELAFPDRFLRTADGQLSALDDRWVNLSRERTADLKWGANVWIPIGESVPQRMPNRIEFSLFETWFLHDVTLIRDGVPPLDLLDGAPSGVNGGQPRHKIEFHTLAHQDGVGILLAAAWQSPTTVGSGNPAAPDPLFFSALGTVDLRLFVDLSRLSLTRAQAWASGARMSLAVTNAFDTRQAVRDATGMTPTAFESGYLDPAGRVLSITLRKVF